MISSLVHSVAFLVVIGSVMHVLERLSPIVPGQKLLREGFATDLVYWLTPCFLYGPLAPKPLAAFFTSISMAAIGSDWLIPGLIAHQPFALQAVEAFVIADFLSYWTHRWLHGRTLWGFHAIHHGVEQMDWLSPIRNHPVNVVLQRICLTAPLLFLGFPVSVVLIIAPVSGLYNFFSHANLTWRFGPLSYILVSPMMHRWHHTPEAEGCNSNYGEVLAIWDVIFGTYRLPETAPARLGLDEAPPADFVGQTLWPLHYYLEPSQRAPEIPNKTLNAS